MAVAFHPGDTVGRGDLDIFLRNSAGASANAAEIYYALYYVDPGPPETEVLIGGDHRIPVNPQVGEYYAALMVPPSAGAGTYRIKWTFKETSSSPYQQVAQEFAVVTGSAVVSPGYSVEQTQMMWSLRVLLRDQHPDKFYHFRPPEFEGDIGQYNRIFGQIWEDAELLEYLERALDWFNMLPPNTGGAVPNIESLVISKPQWRTAVLWGAIVHACFALSLNWVADEFSIRGDQEVTVFLSDGTQVSIPIKELYEVCKSAD